MDRKDSTPPIRELQVNFKPSMTRELEKIAEREGVSDPAAFILLGIAKFIREKKELYKKRGLILDNGMKPLPRHEYFEKNILGHLIQHPEFIAKLDISENDFYEANDIVIYKALLQMQAEGIPSGDIELRQYLVEKGLIDRIDGGLLYIGGLVDNATDGNFEYQASKLKEAARLRVLCRLGQELSQAAVNGADNKKIEKIRKQITETGDDYVSTNKRKLKVIPASEVPDSGGVSALWEGGFPYPESVIQINSLPGVCKTTFMYNFCGYASHGLNFLELSFVRPLKCLMADLETPSWFRKVKLESIGLPGPFDNLYFLDSLRILEDFKELCKLGRELKIDIIVFDTQSRIFQMNDENSNSEANLIADKLRALVRETGSAITLVHHQRISERQNVYGGRGASAIAGMVDMVINLEALDLETVKIRISKDRIANNLCELFIRKIEGTFERFNPPESESGFEIFRAETFIIDLLRFGTSERTSEIQKAAQAQGFHEKMITRALQKLLVCGRLRRIKRGIYQLSKVKDIKDSSIGDVPNVPNSDFDLEIPKANEEKMFSEGNEIGKRDTDLCTRCWKIRIACICN